MEKVNLLLDIVGFKNAKNGDLLVKKGDNLELVSQETLLKDIDKAVQDFTNKINNLSFNVNTQIETYKKELEKVLSDFDKLKVAYVNALIEIDILAGEIDKPETEEAYDNLVQEYFEKVGL